TSIPQNEIPAFLELALMMQKDHVTSVQINNDVTPTYSPDFDVLHEWILVEVRGASDREKQPEPSNDGSESQDSSADTSTETSDDEPADTSDEASGYQNEGEEHASASEKPGEPNAEGKCYRKGYEPGDDFPGYPGPDGGTGEQGTGEQE